jgi:hypothetical protein
MYRVPCFVGLALTLTVVATTANGQGYQISDGHHYQTPRVYSKVYIASVVRRPQYFWVTTIAREMYERLKLQNSNVDFKNIESFSPVQDSPKLADNGYTHYMVLTTETIQDPVLGKSVEQIKFQVGKIKRLSAGGPIEEEDLLLVTRDLISLDGLQLWDCYGTTNCNLIDPGTVAGDELPKFEKIFPEVSGALQYYVSCLTGKEEIRAVKETISRILWQSIRNRQLNPVEIDEFALPVENPCRTTFSMSEAAHLVVSGSVSLEGPEIGIIIKIRDRVLFLHQKARQKLAQANTEGREEHIDSASDLEVDPQVVRITCSYHGQEDELKEGVGEDVVESLAEYIRSRMLNIPYTPSNDPDPWICH